MATTTDLVAVIVALVLVGLALGFAFSVSLVTGIVAVLLVVFSAGLVLALGKDV